MAEDVYDRTLHNHHVLLLAAAGSLVTVGASGTLVYSSVCEVATINTETAPSSVDNDTAPVEDEEDPYENLPEEDEETSCTMCRTFRQGPCRPTWRKLEHCFKDHDDEENGAVKCMRYFSPHQECLMSYTNLYQLISMDMKQELLGDAEMSVRDDERRSWNPQVDWSVWQQFVQEQGLYFNQTIPYESKETPLWKRFPENTEPVLIPVVVHMPKRDAESKLYLKLAYAVDQDGMALGLSYNREYGKLVEISNQTEKDKVPEEADAATAEKEAKETAAFLDESVPFELEFNILPGNTKQVCIKALYAEDPTTVGSEKEILDAILCESPPISLKTAANVV
jgi:hypothetical protein